MSLCGFPEARTFQKHEPMEEEDCTASWMEISRFPLPALRCIYAAGWEVDVMSFW